MNNWIKPITDRTATDVRNIDAGSLEYQKGALNADDLNRIEGNFAYLAEKLEGDAIMIPHTLRGAEWQENDLPYQSEINRIRANYNALVRLFLRGLGLPILYNRNYLDFSEVNNWERIVDIGKTIFDGMEKENRYCGMTESGGDRLL